MQATPTRRMPAVAGLLLGCLLVTSCDTEAPNGLPSPESGSGMSPGRSNEPTESSEESSTQLPELSPSSPPEALPALPAPIADPSYPVLGFEGRADAQVYGTGEIQDDGLGQYMSVTIASGSSFSGPVFLDLDEAVTDTYTLPEITEASELGGRFLVEAVLDGPAVCLDSPASRQRWVDAWSEWLSPDIREEAVAAVTEDEDAGEFSLVPTQDTSYDCVYANSGPRFTLFDGSLREIAINGEDLRLNYTVWTEIPASNPNDPIGREAYIEHTGGVTVGVRQQDDGTFRVSQVFTEVASDWHIRD